ncbi:MAG TPA: DUF3969 family protein [Enhygromyxa sp.]|nr:DUF3969 family protein [Enhygromyxa sp.]
MTENPEAPEHARLILQARGSEEIQVLVAIVSLGMCRALADGAVAPDYACARLFGPVLLGRMERLGVVPQLRDAIHLATELEDVSNVVPHALEESIGEIERQLIAAIQSLAKPTDGERWIAPQGATSSTSETISN